jgi:MFS family permease
MLVTTVVMTTLVVGPFYLSGGLGLEAAHVGLVLSCGPLLAALTGVPAGRLVDRFGANRIGLAGLIAMALGSALLAVMPMNVAGYLAPLAVLTVGYGLFQAANHTAIMRDVGEDRRGVVAGLLHLARNLGLITGASLMGTVYSLAGPRVTFTLASALIVVALAIGYATFRRRPDPGSDLAALTS